MFLCIHFGGSHTILMQMRGYSILFYCVSLTVALCSQPGQSKLGWTGQVISILWGKKWQGMILICMKKHLGRRSPRLCFSQKPPAACGEVPLTRDVRSWQLVVFPSVTGAATRDFGQKLTWVGVRLLYPRLSVASSRGSQLALTSVGPTSPKNSWHGSSIGCQVSSPTLSFQGPRAGIPILILVDRLLLAWDELWGKR